MAGARGRSGTLPPMPGPSDSSSRAKGRPGAGRPTPGGGPKRAGGPARSSGGSRRSGGAPAGPDGGRKRPGGPSAKTGRSAGPGGKRPGASRAKGGPPKRSSARDDRDGVTEVHVKGWGSLARKGAARIAPREGVGDSASAEWRKAVQEARDKGLGTEFTPEEWIRVDEVRDEASGAVARGRQTTRRTERGVAGAPPPIADQHDELGKAVGARQGEKLAKVVRDAARAFDRERYPEARKLLAPVTERVPTFAPARELLGVTYYRMGRWKQAVRELEAFRDLTDSTEQHPVLADCYRALGKWKRVDELWVELREASPSAELVTEGRIVTAGALADQGEIRPAIALLGAHGWKLPKAPREHHLRRAYALADLYERAGDVPHARELFARVERADPDFGDVAERRRAL